MPLPTSFKSSYGPWAIITGASAGMGVEYAKSIAEAGLSVVLVARRKERLDELAAHLRSSFNVDALVVPADLSTPDGCKSVIEATSLLDVGLLINNAGFEIYGSFFRIDAVEHAKMVALNCIAPMTLAHAVGRRMADQQRGGIIFMSSLVSHNSPWFASYGGSKAFISTFALSLHEELKVKGVHVLCVEPGFVATEMGTRVLQDVDGSKMGPVMTAEDCVKSALNAFVAGKAMEVPGFTNKIMSSLFDLIPRSLKMKVLGSMLNNAMSEEVRTYK